MKEATQAAVSEAAKYGFAMVFMFLAILALSLAVVAMWRTQNKREQDLQQIIKENTTAFIQLQATINVLISKL